MHDSVGTMNEEDFDDLFADPLNGALDEEQIQQQLDNVAAVPPPPPPAGLAERIDHLRLNGCSEHIAWSRIGSVAYLSKDRREVRLAYLRYRSDKGDWAKVEYTDSLFQQHLGSLFKGRELAHLSWNSTAVELLVADVCGRVGIFSVAIALNRLVINKIFSADQDDSLNALVGMTWVNQKRPVSQSSSLLFIAVQNVIVDPIRCAFLGWAGNMATRGKRPSARNSTGVSTIPLCQGSARNLQFLWSTAGA